MSDAASRILDAIRNRIIKHRRVVVFGIILAQALLANYLAFSIRFDSSVPPEYVSKFLAYAPLLLLFRFLFSIQAGLYKGLWRYASINDLLNIIKSTTYGSVVFFVTVHYIFADSDYPRSVFAVDWLLFIIIAGGSRLLIRVFREYMVADPDRKKILIVGATDSGEAIVREMKSTLAGSYEPVGFIDNDAQKVGLTIHGVPILGRSGDLPEIIERCKPDEILISASNNARTSIREVYELSKPFNIPIKKLPGINDFLDGNVSVAARLGQRLVEANLVREEQISEALTLQEREGGRLGSKLVKLGYLSEEKLVAFLNRQYGISHMRPISLEDLLQREPVSTDISTVRAFIEGKPVMVTGAGGSIGSELCRQIVQYKPSRLIMLDRYENSLYEVGLELGRSLEGVVTATIIGDVQDAASLDRIFSCHKPEIVFHAAAYKHVPLMEESPIEAVKNNIFGTKNILEAAARHCVESFVLISTDKAVNPTSVMGATKRIAELLTVSMNASCGTKFSTVRFGNVLGSNGSVVPIFREQLKRGGPLTVTHPEIKRFFMLIPEAVQLVLTAASTGKGGELFVLDMGEQIRIADFAENFIRLSGFIPHKEIKIVYSGLRPGEKLYEELFDMSETVLTTTHAKIMRAMTEVPPRDGLNVFVGELDRIVRNHSVHEIYEAIQSVVPNYRTNGSGQERQVEKASPSPLPTKPVMCEES